MNRISLAFFLIISATLLQAQVKWIHDFELAKALAISNQKLIVLDFWAVWCGPCKTMDAEMWNTSKMDDFSDKFIFMKVDVDAERSLAISYRAQSIPKVVIITPDEMIIWQNVGFGGAETYLNAFNNIPLNSLPPEYSELITDNKNYQPAMIIADWFQNVSKDIEDSRMKVKFLQMSDLYYKDAAKKTTEESVHQTIEMQQALNIAYRGNTKKAIKKISKLEENELKNFILAYCYKCEGQEEEMKKYLEKIKSPHFLSQLN